MRAAAFPTAHDVVTLSNQLGSAPEIEIGERPSKISHERLDIFSAPAWRVQRVLQKHVRSGKVIDNTKIASLSPEIGEPAAYNCFVILFFGHGEFLQWLLLEARSAIASSV